MFQLCFWCLYLCFIFVCVGTAHTRRSPFDTDPLSEEEHRGSSERKSSLTELGNKLTSLIMPKFKTLVTRRSLLASRGHYSPRWLGHVGRV